MQRCCCSDFNSVLARFLCYLLKGPMKRDFLDIYFYYYCFSIWIFFHEHSRFTRQQGKGEGIYLTPLYHFHPLHRHLDISRAITAESSPLHSWQPDSSREPLVSERKSLTTKLRALIYLTTFFGVCKFKNASAMRVIFFFKMFKI